MLTNTELRTLSLVCNTIVPSVSGHLPSSEFYERAAGDIGVEKALADIIESRLEPGSRDQFRTLLRVLDSRLYNFLLTGRPVKFSALTNVSRAEYMKRWRDSRLPAKSAGFQALKRLTCFLFYTITDGSGNNPNWEAIGYPGPQPGERRTHPDTLRIKPIIPDRDLDITCDVCIVGSGAGGSVIAYELSRRGLDVLVVEAGGYETADSFNQKELEMTERLFHRYGTSSTKDLSFVLLAGASAGGGTTVNWSTCLRPPPFVLEEWEREHGIPDLTGEKLSGYIDEVWSTLRVGTSESQRNPNNDAIWRGCERLGYAVGTDFEVINRNAVGCEMRCGFCTYGCAYSCKQSTLMNYLPMASEHGARFLFNTKIERVVVQAGAARGVEADFSGGGKRFRVSVRSRIVVAACGAIETPALLLRSGIRGKNIGQNLRLHPTTAVSGYFEREVRAWEGPPQTVAVRKFLDIDGTHHGFWIEAAPAHPGLWALSIPWVDGPAHKQLMKDKFNHSTATIVLVRDWGRGQVEIDKHGSPIVSYKLDDRDRQNMIMGMEQAAMILRAAGASELSTLHSDGLSVGTGGNAVTERMLDTFLSEIRARGIQRNKVMLYSAHIMGSCAMGSDESRAAVSPEGELYGVTNLFVGDASVFPTAPGVNPMITIMAMARRTAEFIVARLSANGSK